MTRLGLVDRQCQRWVFGLGLDERLPSVFRVPALANLISHSQYRYGTGQRGGPRQGACAQLSRLYDLCLRHEVAPRTASAPRTLWRHSVTYSG